MNTDQPADTGASLHIQALVQRCATRRRFRRGALLIQQGDSGDSLYVVLSGRLRAFVADAHGKELTLGQYGALDYVGEMSLDGGTRSAHVEALEATECAVVQRAELLAYIADHPEFALVLLSRVIRRARMATDSARNLALLDVYGRLSRLLTAMAEPPDARGWRRLREPVTHQMLAQHLACSREMVSRLLKDLSTGGYIEVRERWIHLCKPLPARW